MAFDFDALKASIKRPRQAVQLCLRGDLVAARDRATRDLVNAVAEAGDSLAGSSEVGGLRDQLAAIEQEMLASTVTFEFEAVTRDEFAAIEDAAPVREDGRPTREFFTALIAASLIEPDLTSEQVASLLEELSDGQVDVLEATAWAVNRETGSIPFSANGSAPTQ